MTPPEPIGPSRHTDYWAKPVSRLKVDSLPEGALDLNVNGRRLATPLHGFGQMWEKRYTVRLSNASCTPAEVIRVWKENFSRFWPPGPRFYTSLAGIAPGEIALINAGDVVTFSTGVLVIYADDESFSYMTPEGHPFTGWITFRAFEDGGCTAVQVHLFVRPYDPLYELAFRFGLSRVEDRHWEHTLRALAAYFGVNGIVNMQFSCIDPKIQWRYAKNIWYNAAIRSGFYALGTPLRWFAKPLRRQ